ncbi:MAG TPA: TIR domain-containing protein [Stellaceae bacterium]|nr:TIR domain-containing protein [Stellaceae bacterium]
MSAPVFLSFASNDRKAAETICKAVEQRGLKCWIATRDIRPGENFQEAITRAIRTAKVMILVFSANANNSLEVKKEIALAGRYNLVVVPVRVEDVVPNDAMSYELAVRQWIDLFDDWESAIERLILQLNAAVQTDTPTPSGTAEGSKPAEQDSLRLREAKPQASHHSAAVVASIVAVLGIAAGGLAWHFWPYPASGPSAEKPVPQPTRSADAAARKPDVPTSQAPNLRDSIAARLQTIAPTLSASSREDAARTYMESPLHKALAVPPSGSGHWRAWDRVTREQAVEAALEGCQVFFGQPCALVATDEAIEKISGNERPPVHDMPRARYSGDFSPDQIPAASSRLRERADIAGYYSAKAPKAAAFHPVRDRMFVVTEAANQSAAEEAALKRCNDDKVRNGAGGPCFLYAVDNRVVLPLRLREPLTVPQSTVAAGPSSLSHPTAAAAAPQPVASRPPRPTTIAERCAAPADMPVVRQYCASSVLPAIIGDRTGHSTFDVSNLFDDNLATAWAKARREPGYGWILVDFFNERLVTAISIANGYQKNEVVFRENDRVRRIRLLSSSGDTAVLNIADRAGPQRIPLEHPIHAVWVQITIEDVFPSGREPDVAISELHIISERVP